ncbi:MAG: GNAT family N-acetyltransferase [Solirubrobacterales bacterium]
MEARPARNEDCEALGRGMKVVVDEDRWLATQPPASAEELTERFRFSIREGNLLFALVDGEEIVGALGLNQTSAAGVLALGMWILPAWRGRDGGRLLIEAALAARPPDVHKIELEVFPDNEAAIGLYEATGFEREGLRRDHYRRADGSLRSALLMARLFVDE